MRDSTPEPDKDQKEVWKDPSLDSERESDVLHARREAKEEEARDAREAAK